MAVKRTEQGGVALSWSAYSLYRLCPKRFYWSYCHNGTGITPKERYINMAALYGIIWHNLVRGHYMQRSDDETIQETLADRDVSALPKEEIDRVIAQAVRDKDWYFRLPDRYRLEILAVEEELSMPIGPHEIYGIPDVIGRDRPDRGSGLAVIDHKTIQRKPSDGDIARHTNSRQFTWYMLLASHKYGEPCTDGMVNLVRAGSASSKRLTNDCIWQIPLLRNEDQMAQLRDDVRLACDNIAAAMDAPNGIDVSAFPEGPHACVQWNRPCEYLDLCNARRRHWPNMIEHAYQPAEDRPRKGNKGHE